MPEMEPLKLTSSPKHRASRNDLIVGAFALAAFFFNLGMEVGHNPYASAVVLMIFVAVAWLHRS